MAGEELQHPQCKEIQEAVQLLKALQEKEQEQDQRLSEHDRDIKLLNEFQAGTKVYVTEILNKIDSLENRLFSFMNDLVKNLTHKEETVTTTQSTERSQKWDKTLSFLKDALKLLLAALAGYLASKK